MDPNELPTGQGALVGKQQPKCAPCPYPQNENKQAGN